MDLDPKDLLNRRDVLKVTGTAALAAALAELLPGSFLLRVARAQEQVGNAEVHLGSTEKGASYEQVKKILISPTEWTPESGELTPTLKVKRKVVTSRFEKELDALYEEKYG